MELLQLKQQQVTEAGLSLAPPSSFSAASFRSRFSAFGPTMPARTSNNDESSSSSVEEFDSALKKRKADAFFDNDRHRSKGKFASAGLMRDVDLHHSTRPLPPGWEQCLDLQSGEVYYFNPSLRIRTWHDPRKGFTPNDWNKHRSGDSKKSLLQTNSYSKKLAQQQQQQQQQKKHNDQSKEHLDLNLNLSSSTMTFSPSQSRQSASIKKRHPDDARSTGNVVAGCRHCLRFVMLPRSESECPYCGAAVQPAPVV